MAGEDKTEKASPQRMREARKRGDIASSPEMTGAAMGVTALLVIGQQGAHIMNGLLALISRDITATGDPNRLTPTSTGSQLAGDLASALLLLLPLATSMMVAAAVVGFLNTRGLLSLHSITPSFRKLNPVNGFKHLFGKESLVLLLKTLLKLVVVVLVLKGWVPAWQAIVPQLPTMSVLGAAGAVWTDSIQMALQITIAFFLIGAADFGYRTYAHRKRLRMTKQEVKEEYKRSEGNPHVRSRMRQLARKRLRALTSGGGLRRVPQADVVITNPTHFAVAIQYQPGKMRAPKVIAKGQRLFALRIKEMARKHNIPIVENKPLAQALFKSAEVNREIPADLYQAVAQVLAFVYRLRNPVPAPRRRFGRPAGGQAARRAP